MTHTVRDLAALITKLHEALGIALNTQPEPLRKGLAIQIGRCLDRVYNRLTDEAFLQRERDAQLEQELLQELKARQDAGLK
jgi:aminoglycoside phosphotransferase